MLPFLAATDEHKSDVPLAASFNHLRSPQDHLQRKRVHVPSDVHKRDAFGECAVIRLQRVEATDIQPIGDPLCYATRNAKLLKMVRPPRHCRNDGRSTLRGYPFKPYQSKC